MCLYFFPRNIVHDIAFLRIRSQHRFASFSSKRSFCLSISILLGIREIDNTQKIPPANDRWDLYVRVKRAINASRTG
ncbi:hypothetical protein MITSMUL_03065 [Mitsuokella multacida DSM 20544]|uniref:Uncharacterized protein n=1 Tax=Mitsuokella multacida DSM 20544 TaxID=500635 RepID=C9KJ67_9FIRM|nr:hypothetical protein MITSMUL_03065 [Mitsuokella multacida DSM 20544]